MENSLHPPAIGMTNPTLSSHRDAITIGIANSAYSAYSARTATFIFSSHSIAVRLGMVQRKVKVVAKTYKNLNAYFYGKNPRGERTAKGIMFIARRISEKSS
jgi:hypothetical protein